MEGSQPQRGSNRVGAKKVMIDVHPPHGDSGVSIDGAVQISIWLAAGHAEFEPVPIEDSIPHPSRVPDRAVNLSSG
jgi:hypothetical protein